MRRRVLIGIVVVLVGYEAVSLVVDSLTPGPGGATSSSYATSSDGIAALAELFSRTGRQVAQVRGATADARLDPRTTVFALDPNRLSDADIRTLKSFVEAGGTLVAGGVNSASWLRKLLANPPSWSTGGLARAGGAGLQITSAGNGSFTTTGQTTGVLGAKGSWLVTTTTVGDGHLELLADASPLQNSLIGQADNAALGDRLAGPPGRPVTFVEGIHGYGTGTGLSGLPARWKWTLVGLLLAAAAWIAARFRRLGDPQAPQPAPLPPRLAHVEALALALGRTRRPNAAAAPVRAHARELVLRRAALPSEADPDAIITAARALGLDDAEARSVAADDADPLVTGRALAKLNGGGA